MYIYVYKYMHTYMYTHIYGTCSVSDMVGESESEFKSN